MQNEFAVIDELTRLNGSEHQIAFLMGVSGHSKESIVKILEKIKSENTK